MATDIQILKDQRHAAMCLHLQLLKMLPANVEIGILLDNSPQMTKLTTKALKSFTECLQHTVEIVKSEHDKLNDEIILLNSK